MAFIREYMNMDVGDPFSLRIPKKLRKWRPGRTLKRFVPQLLNFVPGGGTAMGFARGFGLDVGDPGGSNKRKSAGAGPKAKAHAKAQKRSKPKPVKTKRPSHGGKGKHDIDWNAIASSATSLLPIGADLAKTVLTQTGAIHETASDEDQLQAALAQAAGAGVAPHPATMRALGLHKRHRSMNPANTKALRRSIRRVESFQRLVKSVYRAMPALRPHHGTSSSSGRRGHRAGCGCFACRKK